jgi:hypothetical protein
MDATAARPTLSTMNINAGLDDDGVGRFGDRQC